MMMFDIFGDVSMLWQWVKNRPPVPFWGWLPSHGSVFLFGQELKDFLGAD